MGKGKWILFCSICIILLLSGAGISVVSNDFFVSEEIDDIQKYVESEENKISPNYFTAEIEKEVLQQSNDKNGQSFYSYAVNNDERIKNG